MPATEEFYEYPDLPHPEDEPEPPRTLTMDELNALLKAAGEDGTPLNA